jgi:hypothetical protein
MSTHDLFKEIDALCEDVDTAVSSGNQATEMSDIQHTVRDQEDRSNQERKNQYAQLLSCRILDIEIQPLESPRGRAFLTIMSSSGTVRHSVEIAECFALVEYLFTHGFDITATGKLRRDCDARDDEDRVITWFILRKTDAL